MKRVVSVVIHRSIKQRDIQVRNKECSTIWFEKNKTQTLLDLGGGPFYQLKIEIIFLKHNFGMSPL